jgi:hypothetical protein
VIGRVDGALNECQLGGSITPMAFPPFRYCEGMGLPNEKVLGIEAGVSKSKPCLISISSYAERHDSCFETEIS